MSDQNTELPFFGRDARSTVLIIDGAMCRRGVGVA